MVRKVKRRPGRRTARRRKGGGQRARGFAFLGHGKAVQHGGLRGRADPGMPISTDAKVSEVGTTATMPIINAKPRIGSIPNIKGRSSDRPAIPPSPGKTPTAKPITTPKSR